MFVFTSTVGNSTDATDHGRSKEDEILFRLNITWVWFAYLQS